MSYTAAKVRSPDCAKAALNNIFEASRCCDNVTHHIALHFTLHPLSHNNGTQVVRSPRDPTTATEAVAEIQLYEVKDPQRERIPWLACKL
jgi:hypothetical protein